jgi:hypothetical protein
MIVDWLLRFGERGLIYVIPSDVFADLTSPSTLPSHTLLRDQQLWELGRYHVLPKHIVEKQTSTGWGIYLTVKFAIPLLVYFYLFPRWVGSGRRKSITYFTIGAISSPLHTIHMCRFAIAVYTLAEARVARPSQDGLFLGPTPKLWIY